MYESLVTTEVNPNGEPSFAYVVKKDRPQSCIAIVLYADWIFYLDPTALARGSVWIRKEIKTHREWGFDYAKDQFYQAVGYCSALALNDPLLQTQHKKVVYDKELAQILNQFPTKRAMDFIQVAQRRTQLFLTAEKRAVDMASEQIEVLKEKLAYATNNQRRRKKKRSQY